MLPHPEGYKGGYFFQMEVDIVIEYMTKRNTRTGAIRMPRVDPHSGVNMPAQLLQAVVHINRITPLPKAHTTSLREQGIARKR